MRRKDAHEDAREDMREDMREDVHECLRAASRVPLARQESYDTRLGCKRTWMIHPIDHIGAPFPGLLYVAHRHARKHAVP